MTTAHVSVEDQKLELDVCRRCQTVWFDADEYERLPQSLPPEPREKIALVEVKAIQERYVNENAGRGPDARWKYIPALFGLPVEVGGRETNGTPWRMRAVVLPARCFGGCRGVPATNRPAVEKTSRKTRLQSHAGRRIMLVFSTGVFL